MSDFIEFKLIQNGNNFEIREKLTKKQRVTYSYTFYIYLYTHMI